MRRRPGLRFALSRLRLALLGARASRSYRYLAADHQNIIAGHHFAAASAECLDVYRDDRARDLCLVLRDGPIAESDEDKPGVIFDYDDQGNLVSIEVLDASTRGEDPRSITRSA